jgi:hypothetical protein
MAHGGREQRGGGETGRGGPREHLPASVSAGASPALFGAPHSPMHVGGKRNPSLLTHVGLRDAQDGSGPSGCLLDPALKHWLVTTCEALGEVRSLLVDSHSRRGTGSIPGIPTWSCNCFFLNPFHMG